jgi:thymidylate kinase
MRMRPGSVVVFEGLDRTGKSTQLERLSGLSWKPPGPVFAHMPSGLTSLTSSIYTVTEHEDISSPLARQLLHLACHAENMHALVAGSSQGGLVLDRWWWSTMAYGWYANFQGPRHRRFGVPRPR